MGVLKIAIPLLILAGLFCCFLPMLFIWFVNDIDTNITIEGSNAGVWTTFQHGLNMMATIFGDSAWVFGIILIVLALVVLLGSIVVVLKKLAN